MIIGQTAEGFGDTLEHAFQDGVGSDRLQGYLGDVEGSLCHIKVRSTACGDHRLNLSEKLVVEILHILGVILKG